MGSSPVASTGLFSWGHHPVAGNAPITVEIGRLSMAVQVQEDEIWIAHDRSGSGEVPSTLPPEARQWNRWATPGSLEGLEILPAPPDRPLVLQPEKPFHLLPGARARIYVRIPLWVRLKVPGEKGALLQEIPSVVLSDTWWGSFTEGELCYWLPFTGRRSAPPEIFLPDRMLCPMELLNQAREELPVEKLLLRCEHLTVFQGRECLWSDEVHVHHKGEEAGSVLAMSGMPPPEAPGAPMLASPRTPAARSFTARTFARIKGFPGLGTAT